MTNVSSGEVGIHLARRPLRPYRLAALARLSAHLPKEPPPHHFSGDVCVRWKCNNLKHEGMSVLFSQRSSVKPASDST